MILIYTTLWGIQFLPLSQGLYTYLIWCVISCLGLLMSHHVGVPAPNPWLAEILGWSRPLWARTFIITAKRQTQQCLHDIEYHYARCSHHTWKVVLLVKGLTKTLGRLLLLPCFCYHRWWIPSAKNVAEMHGCLLLLHNEAPIHVK